MSSRRVLFCLAYLAIIHQICAITTFNLNQNTPTDVNITSSIMVSFPPTENAFAAVAVASSSFPSYQDPTISAPGTFINVSFFIEMWDSTTKLVTEPDMPIVITIVNSAFNVNTKLYLWNSAVQSWAASLYSCSNETSILDNDTLTAFVCHTGQFALFDISTENSGGASVIQKTTTSTQSPSKAGVIAAAVIVPVFVVLIVIILVYMFMVRYKHNQKEKDLEQPNVTQLTTKTAPAPTVEEESVDSYSSNSSASSLSASYIEKAKQNEETTAEVPPPVVAPVVPAPVVPVPVSAPETKKEEPAKPKEDDSASSSSSSSDSDSDSSSSESD